MVLADAEDVEAGLIGELDLLHEVTQTLRGADGPPGLRVGRHVRESIDAKFHDRLLCLEGGQSYVSLSTHGSIVAALTLVKAL